MCRHTERAKKWGRSMRSNFIDIFLLVFILFSDNEVKSETV